MLFQETIEIFVNMRIKKKQLIGNLGNGVGDWVGRRATPGAREAW